MASVFLSYDRDDTARARPIAVALEKAGHSVWWDRHIKGGVQYSKEIEAALEAADAVVVLWSTNSVESAWVRDEAAAGRDSGRLVPVLIDGTDPPLGFRQYQAIDLPRFKGRGRSDGLDELLMSVSALGGPGSPSAKASEPSPRKRIFFRGADYAAGIFCDRRSPGRSIRVSENDGQRRRHSNGSSRGGGSVSSDSRNNSQPHGHAWKTSVG